MMLSKTMRNLTQYDKLMYSDLVSRLKSQRWLLFAFDPQCCICVAAPIGVVS